VPDVNAGCRAVEVRTWFMSSRVEKTFASPTLMRSISRPSITSYARLMDSERYVHDVNGDVRRAEPWPIQP
jgi:hypothetical protein